MPGAILYGLFSRPTSSGGSVDLDAGWWASDAPLQTWAREIREDLWADGDVGELLLGVVVMARIVSPPGIKSPSFHSNALLCLKRVDRNNHR